MKKKIAAFLLVGLIAFILGGIYTASINGLDINTALLGSFNKKESQAQKTNYTVANANTAQVYSVADIVDKAGPAVVNIEVQSTARNPFIDDLFYRQFFGRSFKDSEQLQQQSIGSGFLISKDGYIITNQHVIDGAVNIKVTVPGSENKYEAVLVGEDYDLDLAVIKIEGKDFPTLTLGNSDQIRVGEAVLAIGQPYGLDHTVTTGVISAKGRPINIEDRSYQNLIQTDAAINPGNSGGPLLNMQGQVIGINTAVNAEAQGIGFAIPINVVTDVLDQLLTGQTIPKPYMGVSMSDLNQQMIQRLGLNSGVSGALIIEVLKGSAAEAAGLQPYDLVVGIDDQAINSAADLQKEGKSKKIGEKITVKIIRQNQQLSLPLILKAKV